MPAAVIGLVAAARIWLCIHDGASGNSPCNEFRALEWIDEIPVHACPLIVGRNWILIWPIRKERIFEVLNTPKPP
jgi:hypothetical protein